MHPDNPRPVFYDPHQRRWRWVRRLGFGVAAVLSLTLLALVAMVLVNPALPALGLPTGLPQAHRLVPPRPERPLRAAEKRYLDTRRALAEANADARRARLERAPVASRHPTELIAFFVNWDDTSFTSLKQNVGRIDTLIPEWLHLSDATGSIALDTPSRQQEVLDWLHTARPALRVVPLVNNFNTATTDWETARLAAMLSHPDARARAIAALFDYVQTRRFAGISVDFESVPAIQRANLVAFMRELTARFHAAGLEVSQAVPLEDPAFDYKALASIVDYVLLMAYDEHAGASGAGPVASQDWFAATVEKRFDQVPAEKVVVALGNYGYDWADTGAGTEVSFQEAVRTASESEGRIALDGDSLNPTFDYYDESNLLHHVWFLDGVTGFNQLREVLPYAPRGVALWRLGSEDPSFWSVLERRSSLDRAVAGSLQTLKYGYDIDYEGQGEILRVTETPREGSRALKYDEATGLITEERFREFPSAYVISRHGAATPSQVALTFDDGPDPTWTPRILDVLKREHAPATFFVIGLSADQQPGLLRRMLADGHEIGNHTFTHPDISAITRQQLRLEMNATERLLESVIGRRSLLFRPPYAEDVEPETPDQVSPLLFTSGQGYYTIGMAIDPEDWETPGVTAIVKSAFEQIHNNEGRIVLLHDGGGDRAQTVEALPTLIEGLRKEGYQFVTVSDLMGLTRDAVMPPVPPSDWFSLLLLDAGFLAIGSASAVLRTLFLVGIVLGVARLSVIGLLALVQAVRAHGHPAGEPGPVAVVVPAFNEEKVIVQTVRSLLASNGPPFEIVVVDDGSWDETYEVVTEAFRDEPRVRAFRKPNGGKAAALNYGLRQTTAPVVIALDADTVFHPDTVQWLAAAFRSPKVGAVAGNAKVGNRINLLTKWQALEYVTSQNLDRRAFDVLNGITVVPGAVGAWRRDLILEAGGFSTDTLAEDADLTMSVLRRGYDVVYEDRAIAWTEAPDTVGGLLKQRFRWVFGTLQAAWKQRGTLFRPRFGGLGMVAMPNLVVFQVLFPLVSPVMDLHMLLSLIAAALQQRQHPTEFSADLLTRTAFFYAVFVAVDLAAAVLAFCLERREDWRLLMWLPLQRFVYRQLMYYVVIKSMLTALRGSVVGWGKLERKATVTQ